MFRCLIGLSFGLFSLAATAETSVWLASKGEQRLWLMGTIHFLSADDHPLPAEYKKRLDACDQLVLEIDLTTITVPMRLAMLREEGALPSGQNLKTALGPGLSQRLNVYLASQDLDISGFQQFRPWYIGMVLTELWATKRGLHTALGVDMTLNNWARAQGKPVLALETFRFQMGIFGSLSAMEERFFLDMSLASFAAELQFEQMVEAWRQGQAKALYQLMIAEFEQLRDFERKLLDERNRNWIAPLLQYAAADPLTCVAVGAGHMGGKNGLLSLLNQEGFSLQQY